MQNNRQEVKNPKAKNNWKPAIRIKQEMNTNQNWSMKEPTLGERRKTRQREEQELK